MPTKSVFLSFTLFALATQVAGCLIPIPRNAVLRPSLEVQVVDSRRRPLPTATVFVVVGSDPGSRFEEEASARPDGAGRAYFTARRKRELVQPLWMHGVPAYYWVVCVKNEGHANGFRWSYSNPTPQKVVVELEEGDDEQPCTEFPLYPKSRAE